MLEMLCSQFSDVQSQVTRTLKPGLFESFRGYKRRTDRVRKQQPLQNVTKANNFCVVAWRVAEIDLLSLQGCSTDEL